MLFFTIALFTLFFELYNKLTAIDGTGEHKYHYLESEDGSVLENPEKNMESDQKIVKEMNWFRKILFKYIMAIWGIMFERAHSIVVVHGISGPKTWVRFPVCSVFYIVFKISKGWKWRKIQRKYHLEKSLIIDDVDDQFQNILFPCIFRNPSIQFYFFNEFIKFFSLH